MSLLAPTALPRPGHHHELDQLRGLAEAFHGPGTMRSEVRALNLVPAPRDVQARLRLEADDDVLHIERVRSLDGVRVSLDVSYLVLDVARDIVGCDLTKSDIFALIEENSRCRLGHADLLVEAISADAHTAAALGTAKGSPLLMLERLTHLDDGRPVDLEIIRFRGDRLSLRGATHRPGAPTPRDLRD